LQEQGRYLRRRNGAAGGEADRYRARRAHGFRGPAARLSKKGTPAMNFQRGKEKEPLEINLVPLIDVMMVILIFLIINTTYSKYSELQINLPTAEAEKQPDRPNEIA